ncbi:MAG: hypothetical protein AAF962_02605 [Actinomycetota bacterium]
MRRIFLDTEFKNLPWTGHSELWWVGLVDDDGNEWSAVNAGVRIDDTASDFARTVVAPLISDDEPRLTARELGAGIVEFCGRPDEFWAWCPSVQDLEVAFALGPEGEQAHARYWDWDLQLVRTVVDPWPDGWPIGLCDLHEASIRAGIELPTNDLPHHPVHDARWNSEVHRRLRSAGQTGSNRA